MVVRAYGTVNGSQIILTPAGGDRWEAAVPFDEDGEYVAEFFAEDEAGNTGYLCTILFAITGHTMQAYIVPRGYKASGRKEDYTAYPRLDGMTAALKKRYFEIEWFRTGYTLETKKGGYTIEYAVCRPAGC